MVTDPQLDGGGDSTSDADDEPQTTQRGGEGSMAEPGVEQEIDDTMGAQDRDLLEFQRREQREPDSTQDTGPSPAGTSAQVSGGSAPVDRGTKAVRRSVDSAPRDAGGSTVDAEAGSAAARIERELERRTGLDLKPDEFDVERGGRVVSGGLTEAGVESLRTLREQERREAAPEGRRIDVGVAQRLAADIDKPRFTTSAAGGALDVEAVEDTTRPAGSPSSAAGGALDVEAVETSESVDQADVDRASTAPLTGVVPEGIGTRGIDVVPGPLAGLFPGAGLIGAGFDVTEKTPIGPLAKDVGVTRDFGNIDLQVAQFGDRAVTPGPGVTARERLGSKSFETVLSELDEDVASGIEVQAPAVEAASVSPGRAGGALRTEKEAFTGAGQEAAAAFGESAIESIPRFAIGAAQLGKDVADFTVEAGETEIQELDTLFTSAGQTAINTGSILASGAIEAPGVTAGRAAGSLLGSAAVFGAASAIGPRTSLATRAAIQPGEEAAGIGGFRATQAVAGRGAAQRLFPNKEPLIFSEEAFLRGVKRASATGSAGISRAIRRAEIEATSARFKAAEIADRDVATRLFTGEDRGQVTLSLPTRRGKTGATSRHTAAVESELDQNIREDIEAEERRQQAVRRELEEESDDAATRRIESAQQSLANVEEAVLGGSGLSETARQRTLTGQQGRSDIDVDQRTIQEIESEQRREQDIRTETRLESEIEVDQRLAELESVQELELELELELEGESELEVERAGPRPEFIDDNLRGDDLGLFGRDFRFERDLSFFADVEADLEEL